MELKKMDEIVEVMELISCTPFARRIRCKLCGDTVFQVNDNSSQSEIDAEMTRLSTHFAIQHQIDVQHHKCDDPNCLD